MAQQFTQQIKDCRISDDVYIVQREDQPRASLFEVVGEVARRVAASGGTGACKSACVLKAAAGNLAWAAATRSAREDHKIVVTLVE